MAFILWLSLWLFAFYALWTPIQFLKLKIAWIVAVLLIALGAFYLFSRQWSVLIAFCGSLLAAVTAVGIWPERDYSQRELSAAYVASLRGYLDTKYIWGGENGRGIDCSGLVRRAMIDALFSRGWHDKNPALWRTAAQIWWNDFAARDMKEPDNSRFYARFETASLNTLDHAAVKQGDLAVTRNGVHVLAFVGERTWIQADPNLANGGDKVILTRAPSRNGWFAQKMVICRWRLFEP